MVDEARHQAAEQGGVVGFFIRLQQALLGGDLRDLRKGLFNLPRGLRVNAVPPTGVDMEIVFL